MVRAVAEGHDYLHQSLLSSLPPMLVTRNDVHALAVALMALLDGAVVFTTFPPSDDIDA